MGVSWHHANWLMECRKGGINFGSVLTLGRLQLFLTLKQVARMREHYGLDRSVLNPVPSFADDLFRELGAENVTAMDYSDYQGATLLHDLNNPISQELHCRYEVVDDGGTLEHIFQFPTALSNAMNMVKVGGSLIMATPASAVGHGFYSFSPELFYRTLCPENGFEIRKMCIYHNASEQDWYEVMDPAKVGRRVETNAQDRQLYLLIWAVKQRHVMPFSTTPQQYDYVARWQEPGATPVTAPIPTVKRSLIERAVGRVVRRLGAKTVPMTPRSRKSLDSQPEIFVPQRMWWTL